MSQPRVALQLYTLRDEAKTDYVGTMRRVAEIGYGAVELAGYGGLSAPELKRVLDDLGLVVAGAHIGFNRLVEALDDEIAFNQRLGNKYLVCPSLAPDQRADADGFRRSAAALATIGQRCQAEGVRLVYHNHAFEFERFGDRTGLEILLDESDPAAVAWEPDVYWIAYAQQEPAHWLRRYAGRCPLVHLKDMTVGAEPTFAEVGEGRLDFKPIFAATQDAEWYIVEQDRCARPALESIAISLRHLREWGW